MPELTSPEPLCPGCQVALVCASSAVPEDKLEPSLAAVRNLGLEPVPYPSCFAANHHGYFAASDTQRAADLQDAFADPSIHGILCIRGGYGAGRLLPMLDWAKIARHPKPLFGYSDVTALHIALNQCAGMVSYHTPMPSTEWYKGLDPFSKQYLRRALFGRLSGPLDLGEQTQCLVPGTASGILCGGNLSLVCDSLGTPWEINTQGKILFLEDIGEKTYRVDGMLTQLRNAGKFDGCNGVLLGAWTDCVPENPERTLSLSDIFREVIAPAGKPVLANLPCGHVLPTMCLPLGAVVRLDAEARGLEVLT